MTLNPGQVDFGVVNRSKGPKLEMTLTYAGAQPNWAVTEMRTISDHVEAKLVEQGRSPGGQVTYQLSTLLKPSAPIGMFKDEITIKTNDPASPTIPVSISANVQSNVVVSPAVINFGSVKAGQSVQKIVLVKSAQPFQLTEIKPGQPDFVRPRRRHDPEGAPLGRPHLQGAGPPRALQRRGRVRDRPQGRARGPP